MAGTAPATSSNQDALLSALSKQTSQFERHGYLFGLHITNSWSPFLHDIIYKRLGRDWGQVRLDSADMSLFLKLIRDPNFYGASVTMPNKVAILPHLDELTDECRDVGACNTLFIRPRPDGTRAYCGANTDVVGVRDALVRNVADPDAAFARRPALVVGGGGAARSAIYALRRWLRVTDIYLVNRDAQEVRAMVSDCAARGFGDGLLHVDDPARAAQLAPPGAVVACVPDLEPGSADEIRARNVTETLLRKGAGNGGAMLEMCYNPTPFTKLGALAEGMGWNVILGTEALIYQGLEQDKYWTGKPVDELPVAEVQAAIAKKVSQRSASRL